VYSDLGEQQKALECFGQALLLRGEVGDRSGEAETLHNLASLFQETRPAAAALFGKQAVNVYQSLRGDISGLSRDERRTYARSVGDTYRFTAGLLASQGRLGETERVLELLKDEEYFEFVQPGSEETLPLSHLEASAVTSYEELWERVARLGQEYSEMQRKEARTKDEDARLLELRGSLAAAEQAFHRFLTGSEGPLAELETRVRRRFHNASKGTLAGLYRGAPRYARAGASELVAPSEAPSGARAVLRSLGPGAVALFTVVGETRLWTLLVTDRIRRARAAELTHDAVREKVVALRRALSEPSFDPRPLAKELYDVLVAPLLPQLRKERATTVLWSLDGPLRYLPMAALYDGQQWLVERYQSVLFVGLTEPRSVGRTEWTALALGVTKSYPPFEALPGVRTELEALVGDERGSPGILRQAAAPLFDENFTREAMMAALERGPRVVHVASHFQFISGTEGQSFLLLGDGKRLTLAELRDSPQTPFKGVDLVTLSACQTGGGGVEDGKELDGLGRVVIDKGAAAVMATLWQVKDISTPEFMKRFYGAHETPLADGRRRTKAEALQSAQEGFLRGEVRPSVEVARGERGAWPLQREARTVRFPGWSHPAYWAPFVLLGSAQ
jgi:CHAT domain-containing protein